MDDTSLGDPLENPKVGRDGKVSEEIPPGEKCHEFNFRVGGGLAISSIAGKISLELHFQPLVGSVDIFAGDNFHPPFPSKLRNLAIYLKGRPLLRQPDLNISILTDKIAGCEGFEKVVEGSSTHHMNRDASNVLTLDIVEPPTNFWQGPDNGKGPDIGFVLDLGCIKTISGVSLVNDPSVGGATKRFRLRGSFLKDGNGDILLEQSLELESTPTFQQFSFEKPAVVRYVKFELLDFWASAGSKGGLEYFRPYSPTAKNTRGEQLCLLPLFGEKFKLLFQSGSLQRPLLMDSSAMVPATILATDTSSRWKDAKSLAD